MRAQLINFHVIIKDLDLFDDNVFNFHSIFFEETSTRQWEVFVAEWGSNKK